MGNLKLDPIEVTCFQVHDGDSIRVEDKAAGLRYWLRLEGIDAPEVYAPGYSVDQTFGKESAAFVRDYLKGKTLMVNILKRDVYNRRVAQVWLDGQPVGETFISKGWAWADSTNALKKRLQAAAKSAKLGLWGQPGRKVRPSTWRKNKMSGKRSEVDLSMWADEPLV